mmetsp:Transcript_14789/g.33503  ORF Transcript_14789/g.33503 Transcript_14789/m.33503 type:complete len:436 (+) Transcript_14789:670-1977(+)
MFSSSIAATVACAAAPCSFATGCSGGPIAGSSRQVAWANVGATSPAKASSNRFEACGRPSWSTLSQSSSLRRSSTESPRPATPRPSATARALVALCSADLTEILAESASDWAACAWHSSSARFAVAASNLPRARASDSSAFATAALFDATSSSSFSLLERTACNSSCKRWLSSRARSASRWASACTCRSRSARSCAWRVRVWSSAKCCDDFCCASPACDKSWRSRCCRTSSSSQRWVRSSNSFSDAACLPRNSSWVPISSCSCRASLRSPSTSPLNLPLASSASCRRARSSSACCRNLRRSRAKLSTLWRSSSSFRCDTRRSAVSFALLCCSWTRRSCAKHGSGPASARFGSGAVGGMSPASSSFGSSRTSLYWIRMPSAPSLASTSRGFVSEMMSPSESWHFCPFCNFLSFTKLPLVLQSSNSGAEPALQCSTQ